jgi:hypothetical protein
MPWTGHVIMKIKDSSVAFDYRITNTLTGNIGHWTDLPSPYNTAREYHIKYITTSEKIQITGSTLSIRVEPWKIVDWAPKMPKQVVFGLPAVRDMLSNDSYRDWSFQLTGDNELKQGSRVYHRVKWARARWKQHGLPVAYEPMRFGGQHNFALGVSAACANSGDRDTAAELANPVSGSKSSSSEWTPVASLDRRLRPPVCRSEPIFWSKSYSSVLRADRGLLWGKG